MVGKPKIEDLKKAGSDKRAQKKVQRSFLSYFKKNKHHISFGDKIESLYNWLTEGSLKIQDKAIVVGALIYFINPLDVIPDLTPFIGFGDDLGVVYLVYNYLQNRALEEKNQDDSVEDRSDEKKDH